MNLYQSKIKNVDLRKSHFLIGTKEINNSHFENIYLTHDQKEFIISKRRDLESKMLDDKYKKDL